MTKSSSGSVQFDAKFLGQSEQTIKFYIFEGEKQITLRIDEESLGNWRKAKLGDIVQIRVSQVTCDVQKLLGTHTYGTGKTGGKSIGGKPLMG